MLNFPDNYDPRVRYHGDPEDIEEEPDDHDADLKYDQIAEDGLEFLI